MYGIGANNSAVDLPNTCNNLLKIMKIRSQKIWRGVCVTGYERG